MEVQILSLGKLFANHVRYEVPLFQRPYVWTQEDQWGPLWEDVRNTTENYLESIAGGARLPKLQAHFLGAIVLQQQSTITGSIETRLVVDGQQRLTTLQLLLDAVQEVFEKRGYLDAAKRLEHLVLIPPEFRANNPDYAFKVWPTMSDQEAFRYTMNNDLPSEAKEQSLIVQAHKFFKDQINQWLDDQPQQNDGRAESLERTVSNLLELVVIDLKAEDDPHVIFETLNARGTPLLQSDLVKNLVVYEAEKAGISSESEEMPKLWGFQDEWWRQEIQQGRLRRPRIDAFLNYWMVMRKVDEVAANDVFSEFRRYFSGRNESITTIALDVSKVGECYRALEGDSNPEIETFLYRWRVMEAGVMTPVLLWLFSSEAPGKQIEKSLRALESHQLRRMACRMTTRGYNRLFIPLLGELEKTGVETAGDTLVEFLGNQESEVGLWPNDQQLEHAFVTQPLYRMLTRGRLRMVLEGIEEKLRTNKAESKSSPRNLTIEHIMPQQWREHWDPDGRVGRDSEKAGRRDHLIHTIGNLTLVNDRLNPALSNAPWAEKRVEIHKHTTLFLNKALLDDSPFKWDEDDIEGRSRKLSREAALLWPPYDKF